MFNLNRIRSALLATLLIALSLAGIALSAIPIVRASPTVSVSLDAASTSQTDATISSTASNPKSFRVGVVVNASDTTPLNNVWGWQFTIHYNPAAFVAQGDPSPASLYPDGASNTVLFGAQTATATTNWAGLIAAGKAFASFSIPTTGQIVVFFTMLSPNPPVSLSANTLLANVEFELVSKPSTPQDFTVSDVVFVDSNLSTIPVISGTGASETVTNDPPHAVFSVAPATGVGPFAFVFDASASSDSDSSIANPGGYFWDFGDGAQDLGLTGPVVTHDYGVGETFNVTLRVEDSSGATGSARDGLGGVVFNSQPSHAFRLVGPNLQNLPPVASFTFSPTNPGVGGIVYFDASSSFDPDGAITFYFWDFGDGFTNGTSLPSTSHTYSVPGVYTAVLTVLDNGNLTASTSQSVPVGQIIPSGTMVVVDTDATTPQIENTSTVSGSFMVNVNVLNVTDLYAWQFKLHYDNTLLSFVGNVTLGPVWQSALANGSGFVSWNVDPTLGEILVGFSLVGDVPHFTGSTILASIRFSTTAIGSATLHLSDVILVDFPPNTIPASTQDGFIVIPTVIGIPPVAIFTFNPSSPAVGDLVVFDASLSYDPDGFIQQWTWTFGDGFSWYGGPIASHVYNSPGTYMVTLVVYDNSNIFASTQMSITVRSSPSHDVAIAALNVYPGALVSGQIANVQVTLLNKGLSDETVSVSAYYDNHLISTLDGIQLRTCGPGCYSYYTIFIPWDTSGVAPGNYTISATVFLATDENPSDNSMTDGQVRVLPPPTLEVTPSNGGLGTKVLVEGYGFPTSQFPYGPSYSVILVSFDDQFVGYAIAYGGQFNFTFNIPHAQAGEHIIKALDTYSLARASVAFMVTETPASSTATLTISVEVGTVYFPGDSADIYALVSLNGVPTTPTELRLIILKPDGSNATLTARNIAPGLYKASYSIPRTRSVGTYAILGKAHATGPLEASAVRSFEVKPSWLSQQSPTIATAAVVTGLIAVVGMAWHKGYFRKRDEDSSNPPF